jgi:transposase-like protein
MSGPTNKIGSYCNMTELTEKRPVGRPSKYKPEYCERVLQMARETGAGPAEYAAEFDVARETLYDWAASHEEFSTVLKRAKDLEQAWWEQTGKKGLFADKFNAMVWKTSMQSRFRPDYTERQQTELTGANGGAVQIEAKRVDTDALDQEQRETLRQLLLAAKVK